MKRILNFGELIRIVEGDPNEVTDNEILVIKDTVNLGKIADIQKRINGKMVSILTCNSKVLFAIGASPEDATVTINGQATNMVYVNPGDSVTYNVEKTGYFSQSDTVVVNTDTVKTIVLQIRQS